MALIKQGAWVKVVDGGGNVLDAQVVKVRSLVLLDVVIYNNGAVMHVINVPVGGPTQNASWYVL